MSQREGDQLMWGYYTLASGVIDVGTLPAKFAKKLARHAVPFILLAGLTGGRGVR